MSLVGETDLQVQQPRSLLNKARGEEDFRALGVWEGHPRAALRSVGHACLGTRQFLKDKSQLSGMGWHHLFRLADGSQRPVSRRK